MAKSKWPIVREAIEDGRISEWIAGGMLEKTVAKNLRISVSTWESYKVSHPELLEAIKKGNKTIVQKVEDALVKRALGYDYQETKIYRKKAADGTVTEHQEVHKKHMAPDVGAACFILKNKDKEHWQNDPKLAELRKKELELRKLIAEGRGDIWEA